MSVSTAGYRKYIQSLARPYKYADLLANIKAILKEDEYNKSYGKKRMYAKLQLDYYCPYSYNTVSKVMRENGLLQKKSTPKGLTKADKQAQKSDNLLQRDFTATAPCQKLVTDITEFQSLDGKIYVSAIFDCYDNACLGLSVSNNMKTELVIAGYHNASSQYNLHNAITHSDRGSQYTSEKFRELLKSYNLVQSMNSASGRCHDNAKCESMWGRAKSEILSRHNIKKLSCLQLEFIIYEYFLDYWNHRRICTSIGGVPPMTKRGAYYEKLADLAA